MPALGYRVWHAVEADEPRAVTGWTARRRHRTVDPQRRLRGRRPTPRRGGALCRILDRRTGRELLRPGGLGGELVLQEEYADHPHWGEGPWHLLPKGPGRGLAAGPAEVRVEHSAAGSRLLSVATFERTADHP